MKKSKFFTLAASLLVFGMVACEDTDLRAVSGIESVVMESSSSTIPSSSSEIVSSSSTIPNGNSSSSAVSSSSSVKVNSSSSAKVYSSSSVAGETKPSSSSAKSSSSAESVEILGTCAPQKDSIVMTQWATWVFTQTSPADTSVASSLKFKWMIEGSYQGTGSGKGLRNVSGQYPEAGTYIARLSIDGGDTITCSPLTVTVAPITGCKCTASAETVDVSNGYALAKWNISGCESLLGISSYTWSSDVSPTWVDASLTFTAAGQSATPTVTVSNDNGSFLEVTCPTVTAVGSN
jgi:hypothetical protein